MYVKKNYVALTASEVFQLIAKEDEVLYERIISILVDRSAKAYDLAGHHSKTELIPQGFNFTHRECFVSGKRIE